jgi:threonine/homoserine/homoserine lactone efflux protein
MQMPIITGILLGLSTLLFVGPVFFYLLKSSMQNGVNAGLAVAIGIILGDIICVLLAIYGVGKYLENPVIQQWFALVGGLLLIAMGVKSFFPKTEKEKTNSDKKAESVLKFGINGFLINFVNPFVFAVWFGFYTLSVVKFENELDVKIVLIATLITIFLTDILKVVFANSIKSWITPQVFRQLVKVIGFIMICFGIRLFYSLL